ncbi:MAG: murein L,D-transpeptidase family protein [Myxococcales bacterium]
MRPALLAIAVVLLPSLALADAFRDAQLKYPRVKKAFENKGEKMRVLFREKGLAWPPKGIALRVFKQEKVLELWGQEPGGTFRKVWEYPVCATSGTLGPKREEGDLQIPEGFYTVSVFNPWSNFHLSLGVSYPNASDRLLGTKGRLGGAIMIHGSCVTIGCVPITDDFIEEVYVAAVEAHAAGQRQIPIHIFPARLTDEGLAALARATTDEKLVAFWRELKVGHDLFEKDRRVPRFSVDRDGRYRFAGGTASSARNTSHTPLESRAK